MIIYFSNNLSFGEKGTQVINIPVRNKGATILKDNLETSGSE